MPKPTVLFLVLVVFSIASRAGVSEGLAAIESGDYETALMEFSALAEKGDTRAMTTIGLWYHEGEGFPQDYDKAMSWYIRAFKLGDGDAYNNLGVMYRDGLGVEVNRSVAYSLFLLTHLRSLGGEGTQYRANRNLRREIGETSQEERAVGLCFTESYLEAFVVSRGRIEGVPKKYRPGRFNPRIGENKALWLDSELASMDFECLAPWD